MSGWLRRAVGNARRRVAVVVLAGVLVLGGLAAIVTGIAAQEAPPQPARTAAAPSTTTNTTTTTSPMVTATPRPKGPVLPKSPPATLDIPAIDVHSSVFPLGLNRDGSIKVPAMGPNYNKAAWYRYSPTPGQVGPAVIEGHVDSAELGPSVFYDLGDLHRGDTATVTREDGIGAVFAVDRIVRYPKDDFPTNAVYGGTRGPELRLITCGGSFDEGAGSYTDNIVVYAHLTKTKAAP